MSTIGGAFSETALLNQFVRADEIMFDDRVKQQYIPKYQILAAIMQAQTARFNALSEYKDNRVEVMWMNTCDMAVEDNTDCEFGTTKSSTNTEVKYLSYEKVVQFQASEADFIGNMYDVEESIAKQLLTADKLLTEAFAQYGTAALNGFAGTNETDPEGKGDIVGNITYIQPAYWNPQLYAYFARAAEMNRFTSPLLISGNNMFEHRIIVQASQANADGKGDANLYGMIPTYFDLFNIDSVNTPTYFTYMLSMGSVAVASKFYNRNFEVVNGVFTRYSMPSRFMNGITYDVFYKPECTTNDLITHKYKVKLTADIFNNPAGCTDTNTGVLRFACGTDPS